MRIILHGTEDIEGMAKAAQIAINNNPKGNNPNMKHVGFRIYDKFYSVKFGLGSVSVWVSE